MKNAHSLTQSRKARLRTIKNEAATIQLFADAFEDDFDTTKMAKLRDSAENLLQAVHEFNAYHNALHTD